MGIIHVIIVNYNHFSRFPDLNSMLNHYYSLFGWAEGLTTAGAKVTVFQRFRHDEELTQGGVPFYFISEFGDSLRSWQVPGRINRRVQALCLQCIREREPVVVHMNGFVFPVATRALRLAMPAEAPLIVQHHGSRPSRGWKQWLQKVAFKNIDGSFFAARELADEWLEAGILNSMDSVYEIMETSSYFTHGDRADARAISGMEGNPILFWAGNLDSNKDPLTILAGFERLLQSYSTARLYMAYRRDSMLEEVKRYILDRNLSSEVVLLGRVPREAIPHYFNSADLFVQGSEREGSGIAILDAMACGTIPVVTDIPTFRKMLDGGRIGALWPRGDVNAFLTALHTVLDRPLARHSTEIVEFFNDRWSFDAVGKEAFRAYGEIWRQRQKRFLLSSP